MTSCPYALTITRQHSNQNRIGFVSMGDNTFFWSWFLFFFQVYAPRKYSKTKIDLDAPRKDQRAPKRGFDALKNNCLLPSYRLLLPLTSVGYRIELFDRLIEFFDISSLSIFSVYRKYRTCFVLYIPWHPRFCMQILKEAFDIYQILNTEIVSISFVAYGRYRISIKYSAYRNRFDYDVLFFFLIVGIVSFRSRYCRSIFQR